MKSMTGYGEALRQIAGVQLSVQLRSLNHRHLDLQVRLPKEYLAFEEDIRKTIRQKITRGRIDLFVTRSPLKGKGRKLELDSDLLRQYLACMREAKKQYRLDGDIDISVFARLPELFHFREAEMDASREKLALFAAVQQALRKLEQSRNREGRQLRVDLESQMGHLKRIATKLSAHATAVSARPLSVNAPDNAPRLERNGSEPGGSLFKGDINEEVVRLRSHVNALTQVVRESQPVGKKIDFMLQEVQRELNTISSKLPQLAVVQLVLEGKERVEKIREQSQNIE